MVPSTMHGCKQAGGHPALLSWQLVTGTSPLPVQGSNSLETGVGVQTMGRAQQEPCLSHPCHQEQQL